MGLSAGVLAVLAIGVLLGALVQGSVGLGLGLVAAPVAAIAAPQVVPELLIWLSLFMAVAMLVAEPRGVHWRGMAWGLPARAVGTLVGVATLDVLTARQTGIIVALVVLAGVGLTLRTVVLPVNGGTLTGAGLLSGFAGTTTSIDGPPLALVYQRSPGDVLRPTLAVYFGLGAAMSLIALALTGQGHLEILWLSVLMVPVLGLGFALAMWLRRRLRVGAVRNGALAVCAVSAVALLLRSLLAA